MRTSISSWLVGIAVVLLCAGVAVAGGRKRIVVLDFEGPKAEKFHADVVKLVKKSHTVVPSTKWNSTAEGLSADAVTGKNIKKVAKKLKIDGVVTGRVEKRRDEYIVHLKLHAGTSGEIAGSGVDAKSSSAKLDSQAQREVKDELLSAIDELEANHGGGGGDDDEASEKPEKGKKGKTVAKADDDDDDAKPKKKGKKGDKGDDDEAASSGDDDGGGKKKAFSKKFDKGGDKAEGGGDEDADAKPAKKKKDKDKEASDDDAAAALATKHEDDPPKKKKGDDEEDDSSSKKKKKKVANKGKSEDEEETTAESDGEQAEDSSASRWSPAERAIDFSGGLSFTARRLTFDAKSYLTGSQIPPNYTQSVPVAGALVDVTVFPMAFKHDRHDIITNIGLEVLYDRVLKINSQKLYGMTGMQNVANLETAESRFALGAVFRYALGADKKIVVGGKLTYEKQSFTVQQTTPDGKPTDIPNVDYSIIEPSVFFRYPVIPKLTVGLDAGLLLVSSAGTTAGAAAGTGDIGASNYYGQASTGGYELAAGVEFAITQRIFARGVVRLESIGFSFKNDPMSVANNRDTDATTQDVSGASDVYFGGFATVGFLY